MMKKILILQSQKNQQYPSFKIYKKNYNIDIFFFSIGKLGLYLIVFKSKLICKNLIAH